MLNPKEYSQLLKRLDTLTDFREQVAALVPKDGKGCYVQSELVNINAESLLLLMNRLGDIELDIRKEVCALAPHLPKDFKEPSFKCDPKGAKKQSRIAQSVDYYS